MAEHDRKTGPNVAEGVRRDRRGNAMDNVPDPRGEASERGAAQWTWRAGTIGSWTVNTRTATAVCAEARTALRMQARADTDLHTARQQAVDGRDFATRRHHRD
ncbi:hypothetical protein OsI_36317 [Oryza sativa Indica Group]|uniref:Uncharacterized protein n=1 Tax=Oryza sativa subsp. indica TaxID=39946 RepID=A2ZEU9_ORYSI|nr:hypothetical protein OsI_36317 [Oryza sativa Indica Group]